MQQNSNFDELSQDILSISTSISKLLISCAIKRIKKNQFSKTNCLHMILELYILHDISNI
jgi:hypothetical protein